MSGNFLKTILSLVGFASSLFTSYLLLKGVHEFRYAPFDKALPCGLACGALAMCLQNAWAIFVTYK
ncbi:MAG TPA: hypothetical protein P5162_11195, partial [Bacteroidia bacterium]|nr:hypothetical protein [Bacteroidia bacterium]